MTADAAIAPSDRPPVYGGVIGQEGAVGQLVAAAARPVHAYLLVGPPGSGKRAAARGFAASLLCPERGCGRCEICRRVLGRTHPDVIEVERVGASIDADQLRELVRVAVRSPTEGDRKVVIADDFHLVGPRAPMVLKTIEEPPESTVFVLLAEHLPPEMATIASRCIRVDLQGVPRGQLVAALEAEGVEPELAALAAEASGGDAERARLLAGDESLAGRRQAWFTVPERLDGTGATVAATADQLLGLVEEAAGPLREHHARELEALEARIAETGERGSGRRQLSDRHRRELRRHRTDELRFGLAVLARRYRDELAPRADVEPLVAATGAIGAAASAFEHNPNEALLLQALLLRLPPLGGAPTR